MISPARANVKRLLTADLRMYRHSGIGRYLRNLFPLLLPRLHAERVRVLGSRDLFGEAPWLTEERLEVVPDRAPIYSMQEQAMHLRGDYRTTDLLWVPHYNVPLWAGVRMAVTIHDIAPLAVPSILSDTLKRQYARLLIERAVSQAARILCVSNFTANELQTRLGVAPEKISVTYPGLETDWPQRATPHLEDDGAPYILFVGNVKPNKNLTLLIRAFERVIGAIPHRLLIAGRTHGFGTPDDAVLREATLLGSRVRFAGEVPDDELASLYAGASAFCMPSIYEGFGLPLLEAMASGCPVICSRAGSLPEVAGDAAMYFDPFDPSELSACLLRIPDAGAMERLRAAGHARAKRFRFEDCAQSTAAVLNGLIEATNG